MRNFYILFGLTVLSLHALAQPVSAATHSADRVALIIGNSSYQYASELANPKNDAIDVAAAFEKVGFKIVTGIDLDKAGMDRTIRKFARALSRAKTGVFYYAGHGIQVGGRSYLVPIDAKLDDATGIDFELLPMDVIQHAMERAAGTNLIFLDACRDNPLARNLARSMGTRSASIGRGLASLESGVGTMISFSTQPGNIAFDGVGRNSPYAGALSKYITHPGDDISDVLIKVRRDVMRMTNNQQIPWEHTALTDRLVFVPKKAGPSPEKLAEHAFWDVVKDSPSAGVLQTYLTSYSKGTYAELARALIQKQTREEQEHAAANARAEEIRRAEATREAAKRKRVEARRKAERARQAQEIQEMRKALRELRQAKREQLQSSRASEKVQSAAAAEKELAERRRAQDERKAQEARRAAEIRKALEEDRQTRQIIAELAKERAAAKKLVAEARSAAHEAKAREETVSQAANKKLLASLSPAVQKTPEPLASPKQLATELQRELKRVGCYSKTIDGDWGAGSKRAMSAFNRHAKTAFYTGKPTTKAIDAIRQTNAKICPAAKAQKRLTSQKRTASRVRSGSSGMSRRIRALKTPGGQCRDGSIPLCWLSWPNW